MSADLIVVDANVLVYALYDGAPQHAASRAILERAQRGDLGLCFTSQTLAEFFSIVTSGRRVSSPKTPTEAAEAVQAFISLPGTITIPVPSDVIRRWVDLLSQHPVSGGAVFDLQLVATMMANGISKICTYNRRDFEGFPGIQILTP